MGTLIAAAEMARESWSIYEGVLRRVNENTAAVEKSLAAAARKGSMNRAAGLQRILDSQAAILASVEASVKDAEARLIEAEKALLAARQERYAAREQTAREHVGATDDSDMALRYDNYGTRDAFISGRWTLSLLKLDENGARIMKNYERDGQVYSYPDARFGYEAEVHGPRQDWRGNWIAAEINWGTIGSVSIADARDLVRVHAAAVTLAEWIEAKREAWTAEDMAD